MKTNFKKLISCLAFFMNVALSGFAQPYSVIVTPQVIPPHSPYLSDYITSPNKIVLFVNNTSSSPVEMKFVVSLIGDNGVSISTSAQYVPPVKLSLAPGGSQRLSGLDLAPYFENSKVSYQGVSTREILANKPLPEGRYILCVRAIEYSAGLDLSDPSGGCISFGIGYVEPPSIISPACGSVQNALTPQNVIFSWMQPPGAPMGITYKLKMVELIPAERNPNDAMNSATTPAFFEGTSTTPFLIYGPANTALVSGSSYAFRVTAEDPTKKAYFMNGGKSEVCSFTYGGSSTDAFMLKPSDGMNIKPDSPSLANQFGGMMTVSGNIKYQFDEDGFAKGTKYPLNKVQVRLVKEYFLNYSEAKVSVCLTGNNQVEVYGITNGAKEYMDMPVYPEKAETVSITTTDSKGNFSFSFSKLDATGFIGMVDVKGLPAFYKNPQNKKLMPLLANVTCIPDGKGGTKSVPLNPDQLNSEAMFSVMRIEILNPYYWGPLVSKPDFKSPDAYNEATYFDAFAEDGSVNTGEINAYVASYTFDTRIELNKGPGDFTQSDLSKFNIYVLRKKNKGIGTPGNLFTPDPNQADFSVIKLPEGETQPHYDLSTGKEHIPSIIKSSDYESVIIVHPSPEGKVMLFRMLDYSKYDYSFYAESDPESGEMNYSMLNIRSMSDLYKSSAIDFVTCKFALWLEPRPAKVFGFVRRNDNKTIVAGATVSLTADGVPKGEFITDKNTGFYFIEPKDNSLSEGKHLFKVNAWKTGFLEDNSSFPGTIKNGQKIRRDLIIDTSASITGIVQNVKGEGVNCYVTLMNGSTVETKSNGYKNGGDESGAIYSPTSFKIGSPKGSHQLLIEPKDHHYQNMTIDVNVLSSLTTTEPVVLQNKIHHIRFLVYEASATQSGQLWNPGQLLSKKINKAKVSVSSQGYEGITNEKGEAMFDFSGAENAELTVKITGPPESNYIAGEISFKVLPGLSDQTVVLSMQMGTFVYGYVTSDGLKPIKDATVIFNNGSTSNLLTAETSEGYFELHGVPAGKGLSFTAVSKGYIGDTQKKDITFSQNNLLKFVLSSSSVNTNFMLGFDMFVTKYDAGNKLLSGYFHKLKSNNDFKVLNDALIPFTDVKVSILKVAGEESYFVPAQMPMKTDLNKMDVGVQGNNAQATLFDASGIRVGYKKPNSKTGAIVSKASINFGALKNTPDLIPVDSIFLRSSSSPVPEDIPAITADGSDPVGGPVLLSNKSGQSATFSYQGFHVWMSPKSFISNSAFHMEGTIKARFLIDENQIKEVSIPFSSFVFDTKNGVKDVKQTGSFLVPIQQWNLETNSYFFGSGGMRLNSGQIHTSAGSIQFSDMVMAHDFSSNSEKFNYGKFVVNDIDLAGVAKLKVDMPENVSFHYEPIPKYWVFIIAGPGGTKVASIEGLTPLDKSIGISDFVVTSQSKNFHLQISKSETAQIYGGLASYTLSSLDVSPDAKQLTLSNGQLDLKIPKLNPVQNNKLSFQKSSGGEVTLKINPMKLSGTNIKGVNLVFNLTEDAIKSSGIISSGKLSENFKGTGTEMYHLDVQLTHHVGNSEIIIDPKGSGKLPIDKAGGKSLSGLTGKMNTLAGNSDWSNFAFKGNLDGTGDLTGTLSFVINGEITMDGPQQVKVKSMNDKGEQATEGKFDFADGSFHAKITIPYEDLGGGVSFGGTASLAINSNGWYFAGGGTASLQSNPFIQKGNVAILLGNYPAPDGVQDIKDAFSGSKYYKVKHIIPGIKNNMLNGVVIDVVVSNTLLNNVKANWYEAAKVNLNCELFADCFMGTTFTSPKSLEIGGMAGADGHLDVELNGFVACIYGNADAVLDGFVTGSINQNGQYCLTVGGDVSIKSALGIAAGECYWPSTCNCPACPSLKEIGVGVSAGASFTAGNQPECATGPEFHIDY